MGDIFDKVAEQGSNSKRDIFDEIAEQGSRPISTVTGQPVATPEESWMASRRLVGAALPIVGDIAGTIGAQFIPGLNVAKNASLALRLGRGGLNVGKRMVGAGVGGFGGSVAGQKVEGEDIDYQEALLQGGLGAASELGFGILGVVKKPLMKMASSTTMWGSKLKNVLQDRLIDKTTRRAEKFILDVAPEAVAKQPVGMNDIGLMVTKALDEDKLVYEAYEKALDAAATGGAVKFPKTTEYITEVREQAAQQLEESLGRPPTRIQINARVRKILGYGPSTDFADVLEMMKPTGTKWYGQETEAIPVKQVKGLFATAFKSGKSKFESMSQAMRSQREKLKEAMLSDLESVSPAAAGLKKQADETLKAVKRFNEISRLFQSGIRTDQVTGETTVQAHKLAKLIYGAERRIKRDMPDLWPRLKEEADYYSRVAEKVGDKEVKGGLAEAAKGLPWGTATAIYLGGPTYGVLAEGFGAVSAWALMGETDRKLLKVLAEGFAKPASKAALHLGGQSVEFQQ